MFHADEFYKANIQTTNIKVKYYKGLGTHSDDEISEVFGKRVIKYIKDQHADESIVKAFGNKSADERKHWMEAYDASHFTVINDATLYKNISTFIDQDLILFSIDDCKRSIPNIMDGLKQSQRKFYMLVFFVILKVL